MQKKRIAVLFGGCSTEYEVSLQSAAAVLGALDETVYEIAMVGITRQGGWRLYTGPLAAVADDTWHTLGEHCTPALLSPDRAVHGLLVQAGTSWSALYLDGVLPILHGKNGEDGTLQGLLALAGIPCIGCGVLASAVCMDKDVAHRLAAAAGVAVPPSAVFFALPDDDTLAQKTAGLTWPLFVKPARAGSSFGVSRVEQPADLMQAVQSAFAHDSKVLVEQAVPGFEVGCAVIGYGDNVLAGEVDEIELHTGLFDYTEKYTLETARIHMPARLPDAERQRVRQAALTVYHALDCAGFARVDLFYTPDGQIVFNEVNTIPGFTSHSRFPGMMQGAGLDFAALVNRIVKEGLAHA